MSRITMEERVYDRRRHYGYRDDIEITGLNERIEQELRREDYFRMARDAGLPVERVPKFRLTL